MYQGEKPEEQKEVKQKFEKDDVCPICLDPLENGKELDYCKYSCGQTIHKKCFSMWEKSKGGICVFCRGKWYSNYPSKPKPVSMHPIDPNQIEEKEKDIKDNSNNERDSSYDKIDIEEESIDDIDEKIKREKERDKKNKKRINYRNKSKGRKRDKSRSRSSKMSISRSLSRSRSRSREKSHKKIKYPKK